VDGTPVSKEKIASYLIVKATTPSVVLDYVVRDFNVGTLLVAIYILGIGILATKEPSVLTSNAF